jgi:hypothetical protein
MYQTAVQPYNQALQKTGYYQRNQQGYRPPRRSLGGQHLAATERVTRYGEGYSPRTAARLYGGRPPAAAQYPPVAGWQQQRPLQQTQMQATTRPQVAARTYTAQPWGGNQAVRRQPRQQQRWGW